MWSGNVKTALANLRSAKWRSILTMLGIIIGVSSVITVVSLGEGLKKQIVGQINQLGSEVVTVRSGKLVEANNRSNSTRLNFLAFLNASTLTTQDVKTLSELPSISAVVPIEFVTNSASAEHKELHNIFVIGTTDDMPDVLRQKVDYGGFFTAEEQDQSFAVIGSDIAHELFGKSNPTGHSLNIAGETFIVRGVLATSSGGLLSVAETDFNSAIFIPPATAERLTSGHPNILQILLKAKGNNPDSTVKEARQALLKTHAGIENFSVLKQDELLNIVSGVIDTIAKFISGIAAISLLVGGIGIMDIMLVSVSERMREIGIRKAVGATNRQILNQFLVEGLALGIGGGVIGIAIALLINLGLRLYTDLDPVINASVVLLAVSVSIAVGIIFGVIPALKAARKPPIEALRNE